MASLANLNLPSNVVYDERTKRYHDLLQNYQNVDDKVSLLYCVINNFLCNERFRSPVIDRKETNLLCTINLSVIYLIAGLINNKGNPEGIVLSISQCMRKSLYPLIFNDNPAFFRYGFLNAIPNDIIPGSVLCALIYLLFSTNNVDLLNNISAPVAEADLFNHIDTITNDINLRFIMKYAYNVMNNIDISVLDVPDEMQKLLTFI
jgi:hypothetical protein